MSKKLLLYLLFIITGLSFAGTSVTWNGSSYTVPSVGEENWFGSDKVDGLLISLANNGFQKSGGTFTLTSEVDFGATAGLIASYWGTRSSNDSTAGVFRLSNAESIGWRNGANSGNLLLTADSSNNLTFNGYTLLSSSGLVPVTSGGTGLSSYAIGDLIYATPTSATLTRLPIGSTDYVLKSNGTVPAYGQIVNASVDSSAAIARSKLASGTADHVVINSGAGDFSSEAQLAVSRGGTNISSYTTGDIVYASGASTLAKLGIGSSGNVLKVSGGLPSWGSAGATVAVATKTADYTLTGSDDLVVVSPTVGTVIAMLPSAAANTGKVFYIKRESISQTHIARVSPASGDTISGSSFLNLGASNGWAAVASDGGTTWKVISRSTTPTQQVFTTGSGTYSRPNGVLYLKVKMVGAGSGGGGAGSSGAGNSSAGGTTTFGSSLLTATGGSATSSSGSVAGAGGTATITSPAYGTALSGAVGGPSAAKVTLAVGIPGGVGGVTPFGGGAATNTGSGGVGGAATASASGTIVSGAGGSAGGFIEAIIPNPLSTYSYSIGTGGSAGATGTDGGAAGAGADGYIEVTEFYN